MTTKRSRAVRIAIFNHKGGVGKTTLTVNIADALVRLKKRVLLVDADPQCNLSAHYLDAKHVDSILDNAEGPEGNTLWSAVRPLIDSNGDLKKIRPYKVDDGLLLLHGDLKLSNFEQELTGAWVECFQRKTRGLRATGAISSLVNGLTAQHSIDFVFFDVGPNIGSLNRAVLLDCDYFIVPAACDLFSLRALTTLGRSITNWITDWRVISSIAPSSPDLLAGMPRFLGYIPQGFRVYRGVATKGHAGIMTRIERAIGSDIINVLRAADSTLAPVSGASVRLGEVKNFGRLASGSQLEGVPIAAYSEASEEQKSIATETFDAIAKRIIKGTK